MENEIIPEQLCRLDFRFVKIKPKEKIPFELEWTTKNNYSYNQVELTKHLIEGGNHGVVCGYGGLIVVDSDTKELNEAMKKLPETFTVKTGNPDPNRFHYYFICHDCKESFVITKNKIHYGEVQSTGRQVVGVGSTHPSGGLYLIANNKDTATITFQQLKEVIKDLVSENKFTEKLIVAVIPTAKTIPENIKELIKSGCEEGRRNFNTWLTVKELYKLGYDPEIISEKALEFNKNCRLPRDFREVELHINYLLRNAQRYLNDKISVEEIEGIMEQQILEPATAPTTEEVEILISDLSAEHIGKRVIVEGRVSGEITQLAIPKKVKCFACGNEVELEPYQAIFKESFKCDNEIQYEDDKSKTKIKKCNNMMSIIEYSNYSILFVQNLLEQITGFDKRFYKPMKIYVINQVPPSAKKVRIIGTVISDPKKAISIISNSVEPLEIEFINFMITEEDKQNWIKYFVNNNLDLRLQIAPDMVGRPLIQESRLLVLHSPAEIFDIDGKKIRGCLKEVLIGDTKTYKSESMRDTTISYYHFGDYIIAESGSRAGITYTIDIDNKAIIWGALPLNDLGYVCIDGLQRLHSDEMGEFREALEQQRVIVRRSQSGEALARTRITVALNPNKSKPINQYILKCLSLLDTYIFNEPANLTRWDIFLVFADDDVSKSLIAERKRTERPIPDDIFKRHVYWVWSRKPEQIEYTDEANKKIIEKSKEIMEKYSIASLPCIHNGFRDLLTRIAVAHACLNHSTDETHEKVIVNKTHVEKAVEFYEKMLEPLEIGKYKLTEEGKLELTDNEFTEICKTLDENDYKILEAIKMQSKSSGILATELDVSDSTIKRSYTTLNRFGLIKATTGKGVELTVRGIKFLRMIASSGKSGIVSKNDTKSAKVSKNDTLTPESVDTRNLKKYSEYENKEV